MTNAELMNFESQLRRIEGLLERIANRPLCQCQPPEKMSEQSHKSWCGSNQFIALKTDMLQNAPVWVHQDGTVCPGESCAHVVGASSLPIVHKVSDPYPDPSDEYKPEPCGGTPKKPNLIPVRIDPVAFIATSEHIIRMPTVVCPGCPNCRPDLYFLCPDEGCEEQPKGHSHPAADPLSAEDREALGYAKYKLAFGVYVRSAYSDSVARALLRLAERIKKGKG